MKPTVRRRAPRKTKDADAAEGTALDNRSDDSNVDSVVVVSPPAFLDPPPERRGRSRPADGRSGANVDDDIVFPEDNSSPAPRPPQAQPNDAAPVRYDEIAVLYFFTSEFDDELLYVNFDLNEPPVPVTEKYVHVSGNDWIYVWRSSSTDPATLHRNYHQINHQTWTSFDRSNDYSYIPSRAANPDMVICRNVGGSWGLAQGSYPTELDDPCNWVVSCDGVSCVTPIHLQ